MKSTAENIVQIIKDYRAKDGLRIDTDHVIKWVSQFDQADQSFLLDELLHILKQTYFSEQGTLDSIFTFFTRLTKDLKYKSPVALLSNAFFISSQEKEKSQTEILNLLYENLYSKYGIGKEHIGSQSKKVVIYLDDVLATGKTTFRDLKKFLDNKSKDGTTYADLLKTGKFDLVVYTVCRHTWGDANIDFQIKQTFGEAVRKRIKYYDTFTVENHVTAYNQKYNCVYPVNPNNDLVNQYFERIDTGEYSKHEKYAFRKSNLPTQETFFTSPANRIRYENILLLKGIEILNKVDTLSVKSIRPLGYTVKSHKTFGLGTQFFTWRNIPNNTPLVFWWENHGWHPLFSVKNRGQKGSKIMTLFD